jgi:glyceraldehyde-3-phosphate dehydrogenase/erythrose-4-phosphate dehydrogenase
MLRAALKDNEFQKLVKIVAINDLTDAKTLAHLFKYDSTFRKYEGEIVAGEDEIVIDGNKLKVLSVKILLNYLGKIWILILLLNLQENLAVPMRL